MPQVTTERIINEVTTERIISEYFGSMGSLAQFCLGTIITALYKDQNHINELLSGPPGIVAYILINAAATSNLVISGLALIRNPNLNNGVNSVLASVGSGTMGLCTYDWFTGNPGPVPYIFLTNTITVMAQVSLAMRKLVQHKNKLEADLRSNDLEAQDRTHKESDSANAKKALIDLAVLMGTLFGVVVVVGTVFIGHYNLGAMLLIAIGLTNLGRFARFVYNAYESTNSDNSNESREPEAVPLLDVVAYSDNIYDDEDPAFTSSTSHISPSSSINRLGLFSQSSGAEVYISDEATIDTFHEPNAEKIASDATKMLAAIQVKDATIHNVDEFIESQKQTLS